MQLEDYIRTDEYGEMFVAGHRVPVQSVLWAHMEQGMDGKQLLKRFPTLSLEKIYAVLAFYYQNKDRIDQYLKDTEAEIRRQEEEFRRNYKGPAREELQRRLNEKRARQAEEAALAQ